MAGFVLKNTLSDNGGVTRGICKMDAQNNLTEVVETKNIIKTSDGAEVDGIKIETESLVSMNMWGLTPAFLETLEEGFKVFFKEEVLENPMKAEYLKMCIRDRYHDDDEMWNKAENALREVMNELGLEYTEEIGEAAFYGPKLDVNVKPAVGNEITSVSYTHLFL